MTAMKSFSTITLICLLSSAASVQGFSPSAAGRTSARLSSSSRLYAFTDADSLLNKVGSVASTTSATVPKVAATVAPVVEKVVYDTPDLPAAAAPAVAVLEKAVSTAAATATASTTVAPPSAAASAAVDVTASMPDLPLSVIGGVVVLALVAAAVLSGAGGGAKAATTTAVTAPASSDSIDVSIPYDAPAMLAYEAAGKPGSFDTFKTKYLRDAVADVKAKQKK